jgi:hypothetical protein
MDPTDFLGTVHKLEREQVELREMLLAFSAEKGLSNPGNSMRLGGDGGENPRASLASSMERDDKGIGVKNKNATAPVSSSLPAPIASAPVGPNSSFAEIEILDQLAQSMARSGMDSRGSGPPQSSVPPPDIVSSLIKATEKLERLGQQLLFPVGKLQKH